VSQLARVWAKRLERMEAAPVESLAQVPLASPPQEEPEAAVLRVPQERLRERASPVLLVLRNSERQEPRAQGPEQELELEERLRGPLASPQREQQAEPEAQGPEQPASGRLAKLQPFDEQLLRLRL